MEKKELDTLSDLHDLIRFGRIEREVEIFPHGEDAPPLKVEVTSLTTREKKELFETLRPYIDAGSFLFNLYLEQHILARVVKSINGRTWRNLDEALVFFDEIQDELRKLFYDKCYLEIINKQERILLDSVAGIKTVEKLKNLYMGDSQEVVSESPSETTGN